MRKLVLFLSITVQLISEYISMGTIHTYSTLRNFEISHLFCVGFCVCIRRAAIHDVLIQ